MVKHYKDSKERSQLFCLQVSRTGRSKRAEIYSFHIRQSGQRPSQFGMGEICAFLPHL